MELSLASFLKKINLFFSGLCSETFLGYFMASQLRITYETASYQNGSAAIDNSWLETGLKRSGDSWAHQTESSR
jgi:hypothetical protein